MSARQEVILKVNLEQIKESLRILTDKELKELFQDVIQDVIMEKEKPILKTIKIEELERLIGIVSIGGDAVIDSERYYE